MQKLAVTSVGQVVTTGQGVAIKLDAFPFTRYGAIKGRVTRVTTDAVDEDEARRMQASATSLVNSSEMGAGSSPNQKFVFPVTIALDRTDLRIGDAPVPLSPGMSVTAEIKTDSQRIIDYVLSPLTQMTSEAMHER